MKEVIFWSLVGGVFSLVGGILLLSRKRTAEGLARFATPFAAGALLAAALLDLLPESINEIRVNLATGWMLAGILLFFLLEYFLHWFHHHDEHGAKDRSPAPLVIAGDSLHNLLDGIAIGAAFLIDVPTGIVAAIAVAAHEIPQEIGDFGLLLKYGYARRKVILINAGSALMSTIGAVVTFKIGTEANLPVGELLALTAGLFIYIAASDLIPTIHENSKKRIAPLAAVLLLLGVLTVGVSNKIAHKYIDNHDHADMTEHLPEEDHHDDHEEELDHDHAHENGHAH